MHRCDGSYSPGDLMQREFKAKIAAPERAEINYKVSGFTPDDDEIVRSIKNTYSERFL
jgi:hypothetical protein